MTHYFDTVRAIVLDKGKKKSKIERLQKECKCTVYEANMYYNSLFSELSLHRSSNEQIESILRFTIGVEIECYNIDKARMIAAIEARGLSAVATGYNHEDSKTHYKLGHDGSIRGYNPCEVVSPVLKNLKSLKEVCEVITAGGAMVNKSCGLHVHFGAEKMTLEQWCRIILNYAAIERAIDSVLPISRRENNNEFCASIMGQCSARVRDLYDDIKSGEHRSMNDLQRCFNYDRYHKVNVMAYDRHKTIEFRQHSGTTDYKKIKNWIDFLSALMSWSIKHEELLDNCSDIDSLPFLNKASKRFYKERANHFKSIE